MITNKTNQLNFIKSWVEAKNSSHKDMGEFEVSVTELQKEPRAFWLFRRHKNELDTDIQELADSSAGTSIHEDIEKFAEKEGYETEVELEEKLEVNGKEITIYGKLDIIKDNILVDLKNPKLASHDKNARAEDVEWYEQTMTYARILHDKKKPIDEIHIQSRIADLSVVKESSSYKSTDKFRQIIFDLSNKDAAINEFGRIKEKQRQRIAQYLFTSDVADENLPKCSDEYTWADVTWKVYKDGRKTAIKVCSSEEEANDYLKENKLDFDSGYEIRKVVKEPIRCLYFCPVHNFCKYYKELNVEDKEIADSTTIWKVEDYAKRIIGE